MAQELKERQSNPSITYAVSPAALAAKTCATTMVQLFNWLDSHGMLYVYSVSSIILYVLIHCFRWAYFGVTHVQQLQNAGHTLLAVMCLCTYLDHETSKGADRYDFALQIQHFLLKVSPTLRPLCTSSTSLVIGGDVPCGL